MRLSVLRRFIYLLIIILLSCNGGEKKVKEDVRIGSQTPDFSLKSLDGVKVTSRSLEGNIVVLNFWATWCEPCKKEIPDLKQLAATSEAKVVGIALDQDGLKAVKPFVEKNRINYTVLLGNQEVFNRFKGFGIPYTLVLDRKGKIVNIYRGPATKASLEQDVAKIRQGAY